MKVATANVIAAAAAAAAGWRRGKPRSRVRRIC